MVAGGYFVSIPRNIDILVAGCSCVDHSSLNNSRKTASTIMALFVKHYTKDVVDGKVSATPQRRDESFIDILHTAIRKVAEDPKEAGESLATFLGMLGVVDKCRPKMLIMENVEGADWAAYENFWLPGVGYVALDIRVDSKDYYIPQTRNRRLLIAFDFEFYGDAATAAAQACIGRIKALRRRASSPVDDFLLPDEDPRVVMARVDKEGGLLRIRLGSSWDYSLTRHELMRMRLRIPRGHPLSGVEEIDGRIAKIQPPQRAAWMEHFIRQALRTLDFLDICYAHGLKRGCDITFKTKVLNLSQNVDRGSASDMADSNIGLTGCITPSGMPFLTDRLRPVTGIEALGLQGLPIDNLVLSTETQANLHDLSGNAMTMTVIGAGLLSLLLADFKHRPTNVEQFQRDPTSKPANGPQINSVACPTGVYRTNNDTDMHDVRNGLPRGEDDVHVVPGWTLVAQEPGTVKDLLELLGRSRRYCHCRQPATDSSGHIPFRKCRACGATACTNCEGNPKHRNADLKIHGDWLLSPAEMKNKLLRYLPTTFVFGARVAAFSDKQHFFESESTFNIVVDSLTDSVYYFEDIKITTDIVVQFKSENNIAHLVISDAGVTWYVFLRKTRNNWRLFEDAFNTTQPIARLDLSSADLPVLPNEHHTWQLWAQRRVNFTLKYEWIKAGTLSAQHPRTRPSRCRYECDERMCGTSQSASDHTGFHASWHVHTSPGMRCCGEIAARKKRESGA